MMYKKRNIWKAIWPKCDLKNGKFHSEVNLLGGVETLVSLSFRNFETENFRKACYKSCLSWSTDHLADDTLEEW